MFIVGWFQPPFTAAAAPTAALTTSTAAAPNNARNVPVDPRTRQAKGASKAIEAA